MGRRNEKDIKHSHFTDDMPQIDLSGLGDFISDKPFTALFTLIGLAIGLMLPSELDYFAQIDYTTITQNPEQIILGIPIAIIIEAISGLIGTLTGLIIGLIIDSIKDNF